MTFARLKKAKLKGKTVLLRLGFDLPLSKDGRILDDLRMRDALPTIEYLLKQKSKIVMLTHLGRPKSKSRRLRTDVLAQHLSELLRRPVHKFDDCVGSTLERAIASLPLGSVIMLENLRFREGEVSNSLFFAKELAKLGDCFVNEAFSAYRAHASIVGVPQYLPSYAGLAFEKEYLALLKAFEKPKKPFVVVLGGAKVSTKIEVLRSLAKKASLVLLGGAMIFTFLKAQRREVGKSVLDQSFVSEARKLLKEYKHKIILPVDVLVARGLKSPHKVVSVRKIPVSLKGLDIGPETIKVFSEHIARAKTVFWSGPLGVVEAKAFAEGTKVIAREVARNTHTTIVGGGNTLAVLDDLHLRKEMSLASTGGGASLLMSTGTKLPAVLALERSKRKHKL